MRITYINNDNGFNASSPPPSTNKTVVVFSPLGDKGAPGKSAYQYATENGYTGTEQEFADMLLSIEEKQDKIEIGNPKVSLLDLYNLGKL
jgi:hypothetical protein